MMIWIIYIFIKVDVGKTTLIPTEILKLQEIQKSKHQRYTYEFLIAWVGHSGKRRSRRT